MCGIAGAIGPIDEEVNAAIGRAGAAMRHRGPDAEGVFVDVDGSGRGVSLAHRRLAIIDLRPESNQPMLDGHGRALVFNGEIYNYRELRASLEGDGEPFRTDGDTEVLLRAFARLGEGCLDRLRGMFAFAAWDRATRRVLLARDRVGEKPLYLASVPRPRGELLLFASEVRALLATGLVQRRVEPAAISAFVWNGFVAGTTSIVRGVRRLAPGALLDVRLRDDGTLMQEERRYWSLPRATTDPGAVPALEQALRRSVKERLVSDVPLGVFLSGGVDSSAVAALAVEAGSGPVRTFNLSFPGDALDESRWARAVAQQLGTDHVEVPLDEGGFRARLDEAIASLDQPTFDGINTWFVSRAARDAGVTVALAGTGGDELFGGYTSFRDLPLLQQGARALRLAPKAVLRQAGRAVARLRLGAFGEVEPQTRWGKLGEALASGGGLVDLYQLAYALFLPDFADELVATPTPRVARGLEQPLRAHLEARIGDEPVLPAISTLELALFCGERLLPDTDAASMAASLEIRVPLLCHEVVERAAAVPAPRRYRPVRRKQLLRDVALRRLDPALFERKKSGFVLPIEGWARRGLSQDVAATLTDAAACQAAGLRPEPVARLWRAFSAGAPGLYWSRIWALYVLLRWVREHRMTA